MLLTLRLFLLLLLSANTAAQSSFYYDHWCGAGLQYLDDSKCAKLFPNLRRIDRDWTCPVSSDSDSENIPSLEDGYYPNNTPLNEVVVDTDSLMGAITDPTDVNLCVILTKRINNSSEVFNKYFCLGETSVEEPYETWSSSKIYAMANAAGHLRTNESNCMNHNNGFDSTTTGKNGITQLGDLATIICSYDETADYSSNSLASYFHDIGWRSRLDEVVLHEWLGAALNQTLGGNYGEATPSDLSFTITSSSRPLSSTSCAVDKDPWPIIYDNSLTALSATEMTRRLAMHRDMPLELRFPGVLWEDVQNILYGHGEGSNFFPGQLWGGMTADTAIFLQTALQAGEKIGVEGNMEDWRIFSKLGAGWSTSRGRGEIVTSAYGCIPDAGSGGLELTITCRGSVVGDSSLTKVEAKVKNAVDEAIAFVIGLA